MSFVAKYPGTASNQIFIVEVGLIQSICLEKNVVFFFPPSTWPCLLATANYLQGTCNRLVFLLTTAPHNLHDCPPLGSLVIS